MKEFTPPFWLRSPHLQTLGSIFIPRFVAAFPSADRHFLLPDGSVLAAECSWQKAKLTSLTLLIVHGMNGSTISSYVRGTAAKAFKQGFNVVRLNLRNAGGNQKLSKTLCHAGQSSDIQTVLDELFEKDGLPTVGLIGFSFGGNLCLKAIAEMPALKQQQISGVVGISPLIDLAAASKTIDQAPTVYRYQLLRGLKSSLRRRAQLFPHLYDVSDLAQIKTFRGFDEKTSRYNGFKNAADYYQQASVLPHLSQIKVPTLLIQAQDDPVIPAHSFEGVGNEYIATTLTKHGGHGGFISAQRYRDPDHHWAENRAIEFFENLATFGS